MSPPTHARRSSVSMTAPCSPTASYHPTSLAHAAPPRPMLARGNSFQRMLQNQPVPLPPSLRDSPLVRNDSSPFRRPHKSTHLTPPTERESNLLPLGDMIPMNTSSPPSSYIQPSTSHIRHPLSSSSNAPLRGPTAQWLNAHSQQSSGDSNSSSSSSSHPSSSSSMMRSASAPVRRKSSAASASSFSSLPDGLGSGLVKTPSSSSGTDG